MRLQVRPRLNLNLLKLNWGKVIFPFNNGRGQPRSVWVGITATETVWELSVFVGIAASRFFMPNDRDAIVAGRRAVFIGKTTDAKVPLVVDGCSRYRNALSPQMFAGEKEKHAGTSYRLSLVKYLA